MMLADCLSIGTGKSNSEDRNKKFRIVVQTVPHRPGEMFQNDPLRTSNNRITMDYNYE